MSKRNLSEILYSQSSDSSVESLIPEPARKRWKSQQNSIVSLTETRPEIFSSNGTNSSTSPKSTMAVVNSAEMSKNGASSVANNEQKQIRYDRQLRLWGDHGQELLESARVCLLNATATGTEILKSLILPGVGSFTIIDGDRISGADVGTNFFLEQLVIGEPRAKIACDLLKELNPDVQGEYVNFSPDDAISLHGLSFFDQFTVVIGTKLKRKTMTTLGDYLFEKGVPFLVCQSYGLVGYVRLLVKEHPIVESHPDNPLPNFMLDQPLPALMQIVEATDLGSMNHKDHSHTPYLILLFKALDVWRGERGDTTAFPRTYREKKELKEILLKMQQPDEKGVTDEENFHEAINSVNTAVTQTSIPIGVKEILNDSSTENLTKGSSNFWILCNALRRYVDEHHRLPVRGTLPDMISDSERYIRLQNVFLRKAEEEIAMIHSYATELAKPLQRTISTAETRLFCKNAAFLRLIRTRPSLNEETAFGMNNETFASELENEENMNALWYLVMSECDGFFDVHGRYPCSGDDHFDEDMANLMKQVNKRATQLVDKKEKITRLTSAVEEICRYGGSELHAIASFMGGVAAQEAIKLITHQYVPVNNTYVFDGNNGQASVFSL